MSLGERADVVSVGDTSFEEFVAGSSSRLFGLARLLTGGNRAGAEDLLQGAFERAYWHWRRISPRGDPERYVRQMLVHASVDRWRRLRRRPEAPTPVAGGDPAGLLAGIRRRRRRHLLQAGAGCVAFVVALAVAVPLALHAPRPAGGSGNGPAGHGRGAAPAPAPQVCPPFCGPPSSTARAAPGTVFRDCPSENGGDQERGGHRGRSVRPAPGWVVSARGTGDWPVSRPPRPRQA